MKIINKYNQSRKLNKYQLKRYNKYKQKLSLKINKNWMIQRVLYHKRRNQERTHQRNYKRYLNNKKCQVRNSWMKWVS
jgi:hypothetical protein